MELLEVERTAEGMVHSREDQWPLRDLAAQGTATMTQGNLYNVDIDTVTCRVIYGKGTLSFVEGVGSLLPRQGKGRGLDNAADRRPLHPPILIRTCRQQAALQTYRLDPVFLPAA